MPRVAAHFYSVGANLQASPEQLNLCVGAGAPSAPSEGFGFRAPPVEDTARKASRCRPQVRERIAEARAENGEGAEKRSANTRCKPCMGEPRTRSVTAVLAAVITPAFGGRTSSVTVQRQGAAPCHLPQGGRLITPSPLCRPAIKMCRDPRHTLTFAPKGQIFHTRGARISPPRSGDFTRRLAAVFHCGAAARRTHLNYSLFTVTYSLNSLP